MNDTTTKPPEAEPSPPDTAKTKQRTYRYRSTQIIVLAWCFWLIGNWATMLGMESTTVAAKLMMPYATLFGLMLIWPMIRLSQWPGSPPPSSPCSARPVPVGAPATQSIGHVLYEWLSLSLVLQVVIWPLMINARWSWRQTLLLDGLMVSWSMLTALIVAWGGRRRTVTGRMVAMLLCLLMLFAEPAVMGLLNAIEGPGRQLLWQMRISPIQAVWHLTRRPLPMVMADSYAAQVLAVAAAAVVGWTALALCGRGAARS